MSWWNLAQDSRKSANKLLLAGHYRSSASRAYYAVFSRLAEDLYGVGTSMASGMEGPRHGKLRRLIVSKLTGLEVVERKVLSDMVGRLYTLRLHADYHPTTSFGARDAREAISLMKKVFERF